MPDLWQIDVLPLSDTATMWEMCKVILRERDTAPGDRLPEDSKRPVSEIADWLDNKYRLRVRKNGSLVGWYIIEPPPPVKQFKILAIGFAGGLSKEDTATTFSMIMQRAYRDYEGAESFDFEYRVGGWPAQYVVDSLSLPVKVRGVETTTNEPKVLGCTITMDEIRKRLEVAGIL